MIVHGLFPFPAVSLHIVNQARFGFNIYKYLDFTEMWSPFFVIRILDLYRFRSFLLLDLLNMYPKQDRKTHDGAYYRLRHVF